MSSQSRKQDHVDLTVENQSDYEISSGFDQYRFRHNALPENNLNDVDISTELLGRRFSMPLFISSMTGGYAGATQVNQIIARVCQDLNLPMGVGSQRILLDEPDQLETFSVVRKTAPNAYIAGNIGGVQLIDDFSASKIEILINSIEADALIVHLNPLQELMQPEGDRNFKGILDGISRLVSDCPVPVIVKETGAGINASVAKKLLEVGVKIIDIAGSGGTSWAKVENLRKINSNPYHEFNNWGLPTVVCLNEIVQSGIKPDQIIASGGIKSAGDVIKSLCLGAGFAATAQPVIASIHHNGENGLRDLLSRWSDIMKFTMLMVGVDAVEKLDSSYIMREL